MAATTILDKIKASKALSFKRLYVKRRLLSTGLFESTWQDISEDVKAWGSVSKSIDAVRYSRVRFNDANLVMANDDGLYNPNDNDASFWFGYGPQNRSLVKIEAGFLHQTQSAAGIWTNTYLPSDPTIFVGIIQGDIPLSDSNDINLPVKPLLQVFRDFNCSDLTGLTTTGMTASQFIGTLRDQTDGAGAFLFRPFFGDTTSYWDYTSSSTVYKDITNTITSAQPVDAALGPAQNDFIQMTVWDALERLAEAEDKIPYITRDGKFKFRDRDANTTGAAFAFYGNGYVNRRFGVTIKSINSYKTKISDFYSRVEVKWNDVATTTAIVSTQTAMVVGNNNAWDYGRRTYSVENPWVATLTSAQALASRIFEAVSAVPKEVDFTTSFVPHLEILDLVTLSYDSAENAYNQRWDINDWADDGTDTSADLEWAPGNALSFEGDEFKLTSIAIDLDKLTTRFIGLKTGGVNANVGGATLGSAILGDAILGG